METDETISSIENLVKMSNADSKHFPSNGATTSRPARTYRVRDLVYSAERTDRSELVACRADVDQSKIRYVTSDVIAAAAAAAAVVVVVPSATPTIAVLR